MLWVIWKRSPPLSGSRRLYLAVLKAIFDFVLGPPLPPGGPGEGPDCHFPKEIEGFWADSGPDPGSNIFLIFILALSC